MTFKQRLFVHHYLRLGNATQAALLVYNTKNRNAAGVIGWNLLRNIKVKKVIEEYFKRESKDPTYIFDGLKDIIENGSPREKVAAVEMGLRLHFGIYLQKL